MNARKEGFSYAGDDGDKDRTVFMKFKCFVPNNMNQDHGI